MYQYSIYEIMSFIVAARNFFSILTREWKNSKQCSKIKIRYINIKSLCCNAIVRQCSREERVLGLKTPRSLLPDLTKFLETTNVEVPFYEGHHLVQFY